MSFRIIATSFIALAFAAPSTFANTAKEQIHCPALGTIQQTSEKVDTAEKYGAGYVAYTSAIAFKEDNRPWLVGVANIMAESAEDAVDMGKETVKNVSIRKNEIAMKQDEYSFCLYGKGDVVAVTGNFGMKANGLMFKR